MKIIAFIFGLMVLSLASIASAKDDANQYPSMEGAIRNHLSEERSVKGVDRNDQIFLLYVNLGMITVDYINKTYLNLNKSYPNVTMETVVINGNLSSACATQMVAIANIKDEIKNPDAKILAGKDYEAVTAVCMAMH